MASTYTNITTNTTTVIATRQGFLRRVCINLKATGASGTAIFYDNTAGSGKKIATLDWVNGPISSIDYDVTFTNGLTVVTTAATTAGDLTVATE